MSAPVDLSGLQRYEESSMEGGGAYPDADGPFVKLAEVRALLAAAPESLFDRKLVNLEERGYVVIGRILHKDGQYALFDSSCRWLDKAQYQRLMHEQDGSLFAAPAPATPAASVDTPDVWTLALDMGALVPNSPRQGDGRKRYWLVEDAIAHTARAVAAAYAAGKAEGHMLGFDVAIKYKAAAPQQHAQAALSDEQIDEIWLSSAKRYADYKQFARAILAASHQPAAAPAAICWSCKKSYTPEQRADSDGDCPHCGVELDESPAQPEVKP